MSLFAAQHTSPPLLGFGKMEGRSSSVRSPTLCARTRESAVSGCGVTRPALNPLDVGQVFSGASGAAVMRGRTLIGPVIVKFWCGLKVCRAALPISLLAAPQVPPPHTVLRSVTRAQCVLLLNRLLLHQGGYKQTNTANEVAPECPSPNIPCKDKGGLFGHGECNFRFLNSLQKMTDAANLTGACMRSHRRMPTARCSGSTRA